MQQPRSDDLCSGGSSLGCSSSVHAVPMSIGFRPGVMWCGQASLPTNLEEQWLELVVFS